MLCFQTKCLLFLSCQSSMVKPHATAPRFHVVNSSSAAESVISPVDSLCFNSDVEEFSPHFHMTCWF